MNIFEMKNKCKDRKIKFWSKMVCVILNNTFKKQKLKKCVIEFDVLQYQNLILCYLKIIEKNFSNLFYFSICLEFSIILKLILFLRWIFIETLLYKLRKYSALQCRIFSLRYIKCVEDSYFPKIKETLII